MERPRRLLTTAERCVLMPTVECPVIADAIETILRWAECNLSSSVLVQVAPTDTAPKP